MVARSSDSSFTNAGWAWRAEVPLHYNDKGKVITLLRYASVNGAFRITVTHTDGSTHFVARPWCECDRNQRLISFSALPKLLIAVAKSVEQQIVSTTSTAGTVGQIINALVVLAGDDAHKLPDPFANDGGLTLLIGDVQEDHLRPVRDYSSVPALAGAMNSFYPRRRQ